MPAQPTPLIGREPDLEDLRTRLLDPEVRLLTLTGPPGIGKIRLAIAAAERLLEETGKETVFVDLTPLMAAVLVVPTISRALGVPETPQHTPVARLSEALRGAGASVGAGQLRAGVGRRA